MMRTEIQQYSYLRLEFAFLEIICKIRLVATFAITNKLSHLS